MKEVKFEACEKEESELKERSLVLEIWGKISRKTARLARTNEEKCRIRRKVEKIV